MRNVALMPLFCNGEIIYHRQMFKACPCKLVKTCKTLIAYLTILGCYELTLPWRRSLSYRNHFLCNSLDWLLHNKDLCHERVKGFFFLIGIHSKQGWTATRRHEVTRKRNTKRLRHTGKLFRKNLQLKDVC